MKKKHLILFSLLILVVIIIVTAAVIMPHLENNLNTLVNLPVADIDLTTLEDGSYTGSYKMFPVAAKVNVTVNDHKITGIDLIKHSNGQGAQAEVLPGKVVETQSLDVDIVSGATYSSKVILKAIENALINNNEK